MDMIKKRLLTYKGDFVMGGMWEKDEVVRLLRGQPGTQYQEADDQVKEQIREWVRGLLQNSEVTVTFSKADGTVRDMLCTLDHSRIPVSIVKPGSTTAPVDGIVRESRKPRKEPDPHSIRVFDLEKQEWRSFRFERLRKVTAVLNFQ
jgi:WYL_2, Sm-like SH3 beta-barrel fold